MTHLESIVLGIIQGLGEFLPISSSGHLVLIRWFFGWEDQGLTFDVALHLGTTVALVFYFWADWMRLLKSALSLKPADLLIPSTPDKKLISFLVIGTIPTAIIGVLLEEKAETIFRDALVVGGMLGFMGLVLWIMDRYGKQDRTESGVTWRDALLMGLAQGMAVIPGTSRSGVTITMALILGFDRKSSARLSFFLSLPIIVGACILKFRHMTMADFNTDLIIGIVTSGLSGFLAIGVLMKFVQTRSFVPFAIYRIALALLIAVLYFR